MARPKKKVPNLTMEADIPRVNEIVKEREVLLSKVQSMCNRPAGTGISLEFTQLQSGNAKRVAMELPSWVFERIRSQLRGQYEVLGAALKNYFVEPKP